MEKLWVWLVSCLKWMLTFTAVSFTLKTCGWEIKKKNQEEKQQTSESTSILGEKMQKLTSEMRKLRHQLEAITGAKSNQESEKCESENREKKVDQKLVIQENESSKSTEHAKPANQKLELQENEKSVSTKKGKNHKLEIQKNGKSSTDIKCGKTSQELKIHNAEDWEFWNAFERLLTLPVPYQSDRKNPSSVWNNAWYQGNIIRGERSFRDPLYPDTSSILFVTESPKDCTRSTFGIILWRLSFLTKRPLKLAVITAKKKYAGLTAYGISGVSAEGAQKVFIQYTRYRDGDRSCPQMRLLILNVETDEYKDAHLVSPREGARWAEKSMLKDLYSPKTKSSWFGLPDPDGKRYFVFQIEYAESSYGYRDYIIMYTYEFLPHFEEWAQTQISEYVPVKSKENNWMGFHECTMGPFRVGKEIVFIGNRKPGMRGRGGCLECDFVLSGDWSSIPVVAYNTMTDSWRMSNVQELCREKIFPGESDWEGLARRLYKSYENISSFNWNPEFKLLSLCRFLRTRNYFMMGVDEKNLGLYIISASHAGTGHIFSATEKTKETKEVDQIIQDNPNITKMSEAELGSLGLPSELAEILADENRRDKSSYSPLKINHGASGFKKKEGKSCCIL